MQDSGYVDNDLTLDGKNSVFELSRIGAARLSVTMGKTWSSNSFYQYIVPRGKERFDLIDEDFSGLGSVIAALERCALRKLELNVHLFRTYDRTRNWEASGNRFVVHL